MCPDYKESSISFSPLATSWYRYCASRCTEPHVALLEYLHDANQYDERLCTLTIKEPPILFSPLATSWFHYYASRGQNPMRHFCNIYMMLNDMRSSYVP